ncbi:3-dehydroquinate synthase [Oceanobacillus profundus]|uniref:3-dehydroquinate synthase n=1 Tax=Oceanobacillus profundus TaxID=372463 RepID=A0A417YFV8_9BACI|nr:3-dehydroquinate synthase [Oceanobacillus profundus]MBR3120783.1 3-dehydroquinate synthase [Oceanobacillus sp.]PAE29761.1 3-dehydroquinate synthase [Paenibacillus sp. 7884-2]MCM3396629.1 3-dehydroquinate synthase [Oceanobacillus profundus]MDO6450723.1 3-dehydroquinate synthase [Oceanobacillus profundus]RHW31585.1 3-dehydroquinate synthase [Oceanobacillus profundus]
MEKILVKSSTNAYTISIGESLRLQIKQFLNKEYSSILVVTDEHVAALYLKDILENLPAYRVFQSIVPAGEKSKNLQTFYQLQTEAIEFGLDRESLIIALGGGVVGDLAGFVAATYMRGIDYIQIPTTILAHDSSVGGKVAINHEFGKNLIGNFYPPEAVIYDVDTLHSLSEREVRSGYAELIKEALIADKNFFNTLLMVDIYNVSNHGLQKHLKQGIRIKAAIVEADERESGVRKYLNLGHTLGHALEAELGYGTLTHGEAVAIGLLFSIHVSEALYSIKLPFDELVQWFKTNKYPIIGTDLNNLALISKMKSDKKALKSKIQMVLLEDVAKPVTRELEDTEIEIYLTSFERRLMVQ